MFSECRGCLLEGDEDLAEPNQTHIGDGQDSYSQAAAQMAKAAKQMGQQTAAKGTESAVNAAAAAVKASAQGGKTAAKIAVGTAAGGPFGTILSAAWSCRHTLFKVMICSALATVFLVVLIASLPTIITNGIFGANGASPGSDVSISGIYQTLAASVTRTIEEGYQQSYEKVEDTIQAGGYDYDVSMDALIDYGKTSAGFDVSYILAAYSVSVDQQNMSMDDMASKLQSYSSEMFPVTSEEKNKEVTTPVSYYTYKTVQVTEVTKQIPAGIVNGVQQYQYETKTTTYYAQDEQKSSDNTITVPHYDPVEVIVPIYTNGTITGTGKETYYVRNGLDTLTPTKDMVTYLECTIHQFNQDIVAEAFGLDLAAQFAETGQTYEEVINSMAQALKMTLYGSAGNGSVPPLSDAELQEFAAMQDCNAARKHLLTTALSLVGKVPYFWGGKSEAGWNEEWNTPKLVTAAGSSETGTIRPYGLDCSGFTDWAFKTAFGISIGAGSWNQWDHTFEISEEELLPGDLGFLAVPGTVSVNHVLIFAGYAEDGKKMWVHCEGGSGVILSSPNYVTQYRRLSDIDFDTITGGE